MMDKIISFAKMLFFVLFFKIHVYIVKRLFCKENMTKFFFSVYFA